VGPAGGETGGPHCLAEVHKLPKAAYIHYLKERRQKRLSCIDLKPKNRKKTLLWKGFIPGPFSFQYLIIQAFAAKCKRKIGFLRFFHPVIGASKAVYRTSLRLSIGNSAANRELEFSNGGHFLAFAAYKGPLEALCARGRISRLRIALQRPRLRRMRDGAGPKPTRRSYHKAAFGRTQMRG